MFSSVAGLTISTRQAYLKQLQTNPLRTKMLTSGSLSALQEVLASWIAKDVGPSGHYVNSRVPKMAVYGAFISAPLGHFLISILQRVFSGRMSLTAKIMQIVVSNLVVRLHHPTNAGPWALWAQSTTDIGQFAGRTHPEHSLPRFHGRHCRR